MDENKEILKEINQFRDERNWNNFIMKRFILVDKFRSGRTT